MVFMSSRQHKLRSDPMLPRRTGKRGQVTLERLGQLETSMVKRHWQPFFGGMWRAPERKCERSIK